MHKGFHIGMILVDLQKSLDTDHTVLLQKIECTGFKESVIKWFHSYLSNRKFFVALANGCIVGEFCENVFQIRSELSKKNYWWLAVWKVAQISQDWIKILPIIKYYVRRLNSLKKD